MDPNSSPYYSTGVLSNTNEFLYGELCWGQTRLSPTELTWPLWFNFFASCVPFPLPCAVGNGRNILMAAEVETYALTAINLTTLAQGAGIPQLPTASYGVVASPANHKVTIYNPFPVVYDRVYVPSSDGSLYSVHGELCGTAADTVSRAAALLRPAPAAAGGDGSLFVPDASLVKQSAAAGAVDETSAATSAAVSCVAWIRNFSQPLYAPPRYVPAASAHAGNPDGIVLASETDPAMDTGGVIHAMDSTTGALLWSMPATYPDATGATVQAGLRSVPAVWPTSVGGTFVGFAAFGTRVIAFDAYTGAVLTDVDNTAITAASPGVIRPGENDIYVSSPTLSADGSALFVHSSAGTLWKLGVAGLTTYPNTNITLSFTWACDYFIRGASPICDNITAIPPPLSEGRVLAEGQSEAVAAEGQARTAEVGVWTRGRAASTPDGSPLVGGGFYQPTTLQQRNELYAAIAAAYAEATGAPAPAADAPLPGTAEASRMLRALPHSKAAALRTSSGYGLLSPAGKPAAAALKSAAEAATRRPARRAAAAALATSEAARGLTFAQRRQLAAAAEAREAAALESAPASAPADASASAAASAPSRSASGDSLPLAMWGGFLGVFPFATPALAPGDGTVLVAQYALYGGDSALFAVSAADGSQVWRLQNITSPDGTLVSFGRSRSSPAVDPQGNVYVGTDSDDHTYTMPLMLSISSSGTYDW